MAKTPSKFTSERPHSDLLKLMNELIRDVHTQVGVPPEIFEKLCIDLTLSGRRRKQ